MQCKCSLSLVTSYFLFAELTTDLFIYLLFLGFSPLIEQDCEERQEMSGSGRLGEGYWEWDGDGDREMTASWTPTHVPVGMKTPSRSGGSPCWAYHFCFLPGSRWGWTPVDTRPPSRRARSGSRRPVSGGTVTSSPRRRSRWGQPSTSCWSRGRRRGNPRAWESQLREKKKQGKVVMNRK